jgi:hypothetical protein
MKTATLLKRAPTLIMVAFLIYACYSIHASLADPAAGRTGLANGLEVMMKDVLQASEAEVQSLERVMLRDPFHIALKAADVSKPPKNETPNDPETDPLTGIISGLTLDATFLQGQTRIAIINGRMYHQGQHLVVQGDTGKFYSPLFVQSVRAHGVTLGARGKTYVLGYPDQLGNRPAVSKSRGPLNADGSIAEIDPEGELAFYKRLLNSPLGKLGKSLTGNIGPGAANKVGKNSKAVRFRAARGSAAGSAP